MKGALKKRGAAVLGIALVVGLALQTQAQSALVLRATVEEGVSLIDLRNHGYTVVFPKVDGAQVTYGGRPEYIYSVVSPNGRSLFAVRRAFDPTGHHAPKDTLIRRSIIGPEEPETVISSPLHNIFQCAVSSNEEFIIVAGRVGEATTNDARDGIFLLSARSGSIKYVAPYPGGSLNENVRSLNISNEGNVAIYEDRGSVVTLIASGTEFTPAEHRPGHFPALMPNGNDYIYESRGALILSDRKATRTLFSVPNVVGAIRISPDGHLVAFGVEKATDATQLKICILNSQACTDGPTYTDWIAGRETFWVKRGKN